MNSVDIVIVSYEAWEPLHLELDSLLTHTKIPTKIYVVDNASTQASVRNVLDLWSRRDPRVNVIYLPKNIYYGPGANVGIEAGTSPYVAVLNNDILVKDGYDCIFTYLEAQPKVGIVGPKLVNKKNKLVGTGVYDLKVYHTVPDMGKQNMPGLHDDIKDAVYVGGSALFMSRAMLTELKQRDGFYFDPQFDFYFEDFDIALRCKEVGYKVQYVPITTLTHAHEGTIQFKDRTWRNEKHITNLERFRQKWGKKVPL